MNGSFYSDHFSLEEVREGIYAAIAKDGGGAVGNTGFIDLGGHTLVFDTFNTQQAAEDLKTAAIHILNQPIKWVINSHWHGDHIRGNQVFFGSTIISSHVTYDKMKAIHPARIQKQKNDLKGLSDYIETLKVKWENTHDASLAQQIRFLCHIEASLPTLELVLPQLTFNSEITFYGTKRSATLFTYGGGHSDCDAVLYIPGEKVMFTGDLLFVDTHPSLFDESNIGQWIEILYRLEQMDIAAAIPGHGPVGSKENLSEVTHYLQWLLEMANQDYSDDSEIPTPFQKWSHPEIFHQNLNRLKSRIRD